MRVKPKKRRKKNKFNSDHRSYTQAELQEINKVDNKEINNTDTYETIMLVYVHPPKTIKMASRV